MRVNRTKQTPVERYAAKVDRTTTPDGCWLWKGAVSGGYGLFRPGKRSEGVMAPVGAHVFGLELKLGRKLQKGMCALHTCDVPLCQRPDHLFEGDQQGNAADKVL